MVATLISLLILGLLILVHEAGHFVVARWTGVRVLRFSMGFGPRLLTWTRGHTEYALSLIPLGGYVKMAGEQREEQTQQPWEYLSKPIATRAAIVVAGPLVNYFVSLLTLWAVFMIGYPELRPTVGKLLEDMPATSAGIEPGDRITAINDQAVATWEEMTNLIHGAPNVPVRVQLERDGTPLTLTMVPMAKETTDPYGRKQTVGLIGIAPSGEFLSLRFGPVEALGRTFAKQGEWCTSMGLAMWSLVTGKASMKESLTGPIGIIYITSEAVYLGLATLLYLLSLFSLSLAIFNVLPIPILDGGHLFFLLLEKLRGNPVSIVVQERAAQVSLVALITLALTVCINDIQRFGLIEKVVGWFQR
jgi:regulator of sigma E protease